MNQPDPAKVQTHFDERAATYSDLFDESARNGAGHKFRCRRDLVAKLLTGKSGRLLDCATGTGEVTLAGLVSGEFDSAIINDFSSEMLERSKSRIEEAAQSGRLSAQVEFNQASVFDLKDKVSSASIDVMICLGLIAHVARIDEMFGLANNLLKANGQFLFQTSLLDHLGTRLIRRFSEKRHVKANGYAIKHYWHAEVEKAATDASLKIESCHRYGFDVPFLDRFVPRLSYFFEERFAKRAETKGSEAIYVLTKIQNESQRSSAQ